MEPHVNPEDPDLYALGALDGEEKQAFEAHLRVCPACAQALEASRQRAALLGLAAPPVAPSPSVRESLLRRARADRPATSAPAVRAASLRPRRFAWLTPAFAFATLVFAVLDGWLWMRNVEYTRQISALRLQLASIQSQSQQIARATETTDELLEWPGTRRVALMPMPGMGNGHGGVLYNEKMGMVACAGWLPPPPAGKTYQLWLVPMQGKPMPLHTFGSGEWTQPMSMHIAPGMEAKTFAVTEEPEGGMPWPTGPKILAGAGE
jgi:anti-sigma-K factor RskA